jgi:hypothetical protein
MKGAGATQDTYTLLRKGIRRLLKAMGFAVGEKRRGLEANLGCYLDGDRKAEIDWSDPKARVKELGKLVRDADTALGLAREHCENTDECGDVRSIGWLLTKILGDDVVVGADGESEIGEGVARDRMMSWTDPEMRHGRKSASSRWNGDKTHVAEDPETELITEIDVTDAHASDGSRMLPMLESVEQHIDVKVERVLGDKAYGSVDNRVDCADREIDLMSPVATPMDPEVDKSAFALDEAGETLTCPSGHTLRTYRTIKDLEGRQVKKFVFPRATCEVCPLFGRCVKSKTEGRTVTLNHREDVLREAKARQETAEFREAYRERAKVERKIAELMLHGLRQARYVGRQKKRLQAFWTAAVVNLKRLFKLVKGDMALLAGTLARTPSPA